MTHRPPGWKKGDDKVARNVAEWLDKHGRAQEEVKAEADAAEPAPLGLPTEWRGEGRLRVRGQDTKIVTPDDYDVRDYALNPPQHTCGDCKYFNIKDGRKEIIRQRFFERLVREDEWQLHHLGAPLEHCGLCEQDPGLLTTTRAKSCPQFRKR